MRAIWRGRDWGWETELFFMRPVKPMRKFLLPVLITQCVGGTGELLRSVITNPYTGRDLQQLTQGWGKQ